MIKYHNHNNETVAKAGNFQKFSNYVKTILSSQICELNAIKLIILNFSHILMIIFQDFEITLINR